MILITIEVRTSEYVHWEGVASWRRNRLSKSSFEGVTWNLTEKYQNHISRVGKSVFRGRKWRCTYTFFFMTMFLRICPRDRLAEV